MENTINLAAHPAQRVAFFIDTQNLYHSAKANFRSNVNYQSMLERAVNGRQLIRAFAYVIQSEERTEEKFLEAIEELGIEIRIKDLQIFHTGAKKADWDVGIAVDMIRLSEKVDVIVLASGDGDFIEAMRYCQARGVRVEVMAFEKTTNNKLREEADLFIDLGARQDGFLISNRSYSKKRTSGSSGGSSIWNSSPQAQYPVDYGSSLPRSSATNRSNELNLPTFIRQTQEQAKELDGRVNSQNRIIKPVIGLPLRPSLPKSKTRRRVRTRSLASDNVFGNKRPRRKKLNEVKHADEQKFNWFGKY